MAIFTFVGCSALEELDKVLSNNGESGPDPSTVVITEKAADAVSVPSDAASGSAEQTRTQESNVVRDPSVLDALTLPEGMHLTREDENFLYVYAYLTGDETLLVDEEKQILSVVRTVCDALADSDDYGKVIGVHDYLSDTISYDFGERPYDEYGAFIEKMAVCQGYSYAFKLCMDICGIDCITVGGTADNGKEVLSHAWNMVRLDGRWYHVDVTWDDAYNVNYNGSWCHMYLGLNDDIMSRDHEWSAIVQGLHGLEEIPVCDDLTYYYYSAYDKCATSQEELEALFETEFNGGATTIEILCTGFEADTAFVGRYTSCKLLTQKSPDRKVYCFII